MDSPHDRVPAGLQPSILSFPPSTLRCCCGRPDCAYLQHSYAVLEGLEKDLATAARLGKMSLTLPPQALLHRHETYVAEAVEDRARLQVEMEILEHDNTERQAENARVVEENRGLLDQLEDLNNAVVDSDSYIRSLTEKLEKAEEEMRELAASAARASELGSQLSVMEAEQLQLHQELVLTQEDEKSAVQRWRKAECALRDLEDQLDRLESEAREEQDRHVELIQRMEQRRAVERGLDGTVRRLKVAAATDGTTAVSRFVRDILQDNASLQTGVAELREMLENSNQEVQCLREQILMHQPIPGGQDGSESLANLRLSEELGSKGRVPQEFHVHHHYHSPSSSIGSRRDKGPPGRRPKKKRPLNSAQMMQPAAGTQAPRTPMHRPQRSTSSTSTTLSRTSVTIPSASHRWSLQSPGASSLASSPQSANRSSSIFDVTDHSFDSSRPTSPESVCLSSPISVRRKKNLSDVSMRSLSGPPALMGQRFSPSAEDMQPKYKDEEHLDQTDDDFGDDMWLPPPIPEEQEDPSSGRATEAVAAEDAQVALVRAPSPVPSAQFQALRRAASHESLLSVSGMDIHTLRERPSQLLINLDPRCFARMPRRIVSPSTELSSTPPVISATTITADKVTLYNTQQKSLHSLLASVAASRGPLTGATDVVGLQDGGSNSSNQKKTAIFGRRVGGWVLGRWGVASGPILEDLGPQATASSATTPPSSIAPTRLKTDTQSLGTPRPPGVNQKGPIVGVWFPRSTPTLTEVRTLDEESLKECLNE
ncbi:hypothetical protein Egran_06294 [Elaphomyces granulatus]|uniref:Uncharacterized protein n=1 Tax=Elaphomyces granulatus TaxID=519963 RepID=A0A232LQ52_9EURO|nr:hypothetical protein Egran_06294 [Elaphomyces granulatus]